MHERMRSSVVCALLGVAFAATAQAQDVVISQVYGGAGCGTAGCSAYKNDYVELFNRGTTSATLAAWSVQYASAAGTSWNVASLPANTVIPAGGYFLFKQGGNANGVADLPTADATGSLNMSATAGKVALVKSTTALSGTITLPNGNIADFVGYGATASVYEGTAPAPTFGSNSNAIFRKNNGCLDANENSTDFEALAAAPRNSASPAYSCGSPSAPTGSGQASPNPAYAGASVTLSVTVTPGGNPPSTGITVTGNLVSIGGSANQSFTETGPGTNIFTYQMTIPCNINTGTEAVDQTMAITIGDAQARSTSTDIVVTVRPQTTKIGLTLPPSAPPDDGQPSNIAVCDGATAQFSVRAEGPNLTYQWYYGPVGSGILLSNGDRSGRVSGADTSVLQITGAQASDQGTYYAIVTGSCTGSVTSNGATLTIATPATAAQKQIVISQVYGGGGNSGATYTNDFIELFNKGTTAVDVTGWTVQYASSDTGGSQPDFNSPPRYTVLSGTIQPGKYFLIQESPGTGGTQALPTPDVDGTAQAQGAIAVGSIGGKVALVNNSGILTGACPLTNCTLVDFVGYSPSSTCFEGAGPAPEAGNTTAVRRKSPCVDTNDNAADFELAGPIPHNSSSPSAPGITTQPTSQIVCTGQTATFTVVAGGPCLSYQWQVLSGSWTDVTAGTGGSTASYTTDTLTAGDNGKKYRVVVSNSYGPSATSNEASVIIDPADADDKQVVIQQVYGGGGNTGAAYKNDFIELYNRGTTAVDITGWSVQYASASGSSWTKTDLTGILLPGGYYLIQESAGNACSGAPCGVALPTPNATGSIAMSASAGKVALVKSSTPLPSVTCPDTDCRLVDLVGYGTAATCFEGTGQAPYDSGDNSKATVRTPTGTDTGENSIDFVIATAQAGHFAPGDYDQNGVVDGADLILFTSCVTGPELGPVNPGCENKDLDGDDDVDQVDYGLFQGCYSGTSPANAACLTTQ